MQTGKYSTPLQVLADGCLILSAWWLAFWFRFNTDIPDEFVVLARDTSAWSVAAGLAGLVIARVYRQVWRYFGLPELRQLALGLGIGALLATAAVLTNTWRGVASI